MWRHVCLGALLAGSLAGCSKILGIGDFSLTPDAPPDVPGPDAQLCWGSGLAGPVCITMPAMGVKTLDTALDTDTLGTCTDLIAQPAGPELCVIAATQINVSNTVTATGSRPLFLLATDTINVGGTLDVSSKRANAKAGAGANFASCGAGTAPTASSVASGGGAGGTFGSKGSSGGRGDNAGVLNTAGTSPAVLGLTFVRGGCKGQDGGDASATAQGGTGGSSGGAVYLFAATSITVPGNIFASGAGGGAAGLHGGGGGGGAGGLIGLEAPTIDIMGVVAANGGNGSAGSSTVAGGAGADGATLAYSTQPAAATNGTSGGGTGGRGATGPTPTAGTVGGNGTLSGGAGGGGGGGTGIIWVKGTVTGTMIAPAPTLN